MVPDSDSGEIAGRTPAPQLIGGPGLGVQPPGRLGEGVDLGRPGRLLDRFGVGPPGPVEVIDSDITVLTASADKVLRVGGDRPYLVDLEPHSYHDSGLERTLWFRQVALDYRHDLPVLTTSW